MRLAQASRSSEDRMRAVQLTTFEGFESLRTVEVDTPKPGANEVLIAVKAAGINFAEIELTKGKYPSGKPLPFIMGFEAAGTVAEIGSHKEQVTKFHSQKEVIFRFQCKHQRFKFFLVT